MAQQVTATRKRQRTSTRKPATRRPRQQRSPKQREAEKQNLARVKELGELYRPLHEAAEAELAKSASGKKLLREGRALGKELNKLYENTASGKTPSEEGQRLADQRREEFLGRHQEQLLEAYAPHARLEPSVEAIAEVVEPEMASETLWVAETSLHRGMVLRPKPDHEMVLPVKPDPEELGTVGQGLGDPAPMPGPIHSCLGPDFPHKEEYVWSPPTGRALAQAEVNGSLVSWGEAYTGTGIPVSSGAQAWVTADFAVPGGFTEYALLVDYWFEFAENALAYFGVAVANLDVAIQVDEKDGTPPERWAESISCLVCPVFAGDHAYHWGNEKDGDPERVTLLAAAGEEAQAGLGELRELAHGIYPAILAEAGLEPALATLADEAPLPVEFGEVPPERYPGPVETAAYLTISEAVNDAVGRGASFVSADLRREGSRLVVTVLDDGAARSSAFVHVADRIGALGGTLEVEATTLRAVIPCA